MNDSINNAVKQASWFPEKAFKAFSSIFDRACSQHGAILPWLYILSVSLHTAPHSRMIDPSKTYIKYQRLFKCHRHVFLLPWQISSTPTDDNNTFLNNKEVNQAVGQLETSTLIKPGRTLPGVSFLRLVGR